MISPARRACRHIRRLLAAEQGMALPTALFTTIASLALAGAAVMSSVDVQQGSHRDSNSKSAIGAADAGANVALLRLSRNSEELAKEPCLSGSTPQANGWCSPVSGEVGGATYEYQVSQAGAEVCGEGFSLCVVASGIVDEVTRRVMVTFTDEVPASNGKDSEEETSGGGGGVGSEGLISAGDVIIDQNADARVNIGTNGSVHVEENGNVCGSIRNGIGKTTTIDNNGTQCAGYTNREGNVTLPPVSSFMPSDIATNNSNYRLVKCTSTKPTKTPTGCQSDTYTKSWNSTEPWNPTTRTIRAGNNSTLTLGDPSITTGTQDYFVCRLELDNNSHLVMAQGAHVRVFFDTPENCGLSAGAKQIYVLNNANITATGYQSALSKFDMPGFYVQGSTTIPTTIEWVNNSGTNEFVLYAPNSDILLQNNAEFIGMIAGKTIHITNKVIVRQDSGFVLEPSLDPWSGNPRTEEEPERPPVYTAQYYVECSGTAAPAPNAGC